MRTIKPPPEWQITCEGCSAVLAYTDHDVHWNKFIERSYVECPHCEAELTVPNDKDRRDWL